MRTHSMVMIAAPMMALALDAGGAGAQLFGRGTERDAKKVAEVASPADSFASGRLEVHLVAGRLSLDAVRFDEVDEPDSASRALLKAIAHALKGISGGYVVKVRATATSQAQRMADRRAASIRAFLVSEGVEAERLFSAGSGATGVMSSRAEILRIK